MTTPLATSSIPKRKSRLLAILLAVVPGGGHFYIGQSAKGRFFLLVPGLGWLINWLLGVMDAGVMAGRINRGDPVLPWDWFWTRRDWRLKEITQDDFAHKRFGTERKAVSNDTDLPQTFQRQFSTKWSYSYSIDYEHVRNVVNAFDLKIKDGGRQHKVEETVRRRYGYEEGKEETETFTLPVAVPAHKCTLVTVTWEYRQQVGRVILTDQYGTIVEIPYAVTVGVTHTPQFQHAPLPVQSDNA